MEKSADPDQTNSADPDQTNSAYPLHTNSADHDQTASEMVFTVCYSDKYFVKQISKIVQNFEAITVVVLQHFSGIDHLNSSPDNLSI